MHAKNNASEVLIEVESLRAELDSMTEAKKDLLIYKQQLDAILDNAPVEIYLKDREGRYLKINKQFEKIFDVKNEDVVGLFPTDIHDSDLAISTRNHDLCVLNSGKAELREEVCKVAGDDQLHTLLTIKFPIFNGDGEVDGLGAVVTDISYEVAKRARFREKNTLFNKAETIGNIGHWNWDLTKDKLVSCSDQLARIYGMTVPEALDYFANTKAVMNLIHPDDREHVRQAATFHDEKPKLLDVEYRVITLSGDTRHLRTCNELVFDNDGAPSQLFGSVQDITVEKEKESSLIHATELALKANKELAFQKHALDEHAIVSIANVAGDMIYVNDKFCAISGYDREELLGKNHKIVKSDEHSGAFFIEMWKTISSGQTWHGDIKNKDKTGNDYWVKTTIVPTLNDKGKPFQYVGIRTEITERKQVELWEKSRTHVLELISSGEPLAVILEAIVCFVEQEHPNMLCSILLLDDAGKHLLKGTAPSLPDFYNEAINGVEIGIGVGSCGTAAFINERVIVEDIQTHPYWTPFKELASKAKLGACWSEPIRSSKGEVLGTFGIYHHKAHYPTEANLAMIEKMAGLASIGIEKIQAEKKLESMAYYDVLTDLPNRALLADRLNHAMLQCQRRNQTLGVAYMDLDGFKVVNDTYGHDLGDELLVELSKRMKEALREGDTLARIGGDEFVALMVDLEKAEDSEPVLKRLLKAAAKPMTLGEAVVQVSVSIGVTLYPQNGADADLLMRHADQAMYIAKQAGKNRYHLFDTVQNDAVNIRRKNIADVRSALDRREFVLHYQPKVNMQTSEVIGVEALIRWQHPDLGLVPPLEFLPLIEGHTISLELGEWVIDTALRQISKWQSIGINLPISVNISAYQLQQDNFTTRLSSLLTAHSNVSPHYLELEILETSELSDISEVSATMNACHELGVRFALDDFGTGYSSLTYLRRLPAHMIKIDQSFVRDMLEDTDDLAIVKGVIELAKAFHREVIAEGVETIAHGTELLRLGCELAQGYGIARPMPADDVLQWISSWKADDSWRETKPRKS